MKQQAIQVWYNGKHLDTVFFDKDMDEDQIRRALEHDCFPSDTTLLREVKK